MSDGRAIDNRLQAASLPHMGLLALVFCAAGMAQTTVAESRVIAPDGKRATGTIVVTAVTAFTAADGARVDQVQAVVRVVNGRFSVSLEPNIAGTAYEARWQLDRARPRMEFWVVPAGGPVGMCAVLATRVAGVWVVAGCGVVGPALSWGALTSVTWGELTSTTWSGLVQ